MNDSLSLILPIRNAETTLARQVTHLLDLLPDLTGRFEIVVVDDASSDHTVDQARELAAQYPQVRLICHRAPRGTPAAIETGLQWAQYATVFVLEEHGIASPTDLRRLWSLRADDQLVMARADARPGLIERRLLEQLSTWGQALRGAARRGGKTSGIQMIRKDAVAGDADAVAPNAERTDAPHGIGKSQRPATFVSHLRNLALGE